MQLYSILILFFALFTPTTFGVSVFELSFPDSRPIEGNTPLEQCEVSNAHILEVTSLEMIPQPPRIGETLIMSAKGITKSQINEGSYLEVTVKLGLIQILKKNFDLCELLIENDDLGLECPVAAGSYELYKEVEIPSQAPAGKYVVLVKAFNGGENSENIGCVAGEISLGY
ncbi:hypothetical protein QEN19_004085 [Hanseniaspora menglaensis]